MTLAEKTLASVGARAATPLRHAMLGAMLGGRDNNMNLLRMIAASMVLVSHSIPIITGDTDGEPLRAWLGLSLGQFSVVVFFAISGLLITRSFDRRESLAHFLIARFVRLWPGLLIMLCLTAFVVGPLLTQLPTADYWRHHDTWTYVPRNFILAERQSGLPGLFVQNPMHGITNGSLWSLFYEVTCYVVVMLLGLVGILRRGAAFAVFMALVVAAHWWSDLYNPVDGLAYRLRVLAFFGFPFALGMAAYVWRDSLPIRGWLAVAIWLLPLACYGSRYEPTALMIALSYGAFYLSFVPKGPLLQYNRLGDYSYGTYIYAFPVQQTVEQFLPRLSPLAHVAVAAPVVLALAVASWLGVERHALKLARPLAVAVNGALRR